MTRSAREDALQLLGVEEGADEKEIRRAWRALVRTYHPDQARADPEAANQRMAEINAAFDVLMRKEPAATTSAKPNPQSQRQQAQKQAVDRKRRAAMREKILRQKKEDAARQEAAAMREQRLRAGVEKPHDRQSRPNTTNLTGALADKGFAEARKVFEKHPRAQIRAIFA